MTGYDRVSDAIKAARDLAQERNERVAICESRRGRVYFQIAVVTLNGNIPNDPATRPVALMYPSGRFEAMN